MDTEKNCYVDARTGAQKSNSLFLYFANMKLYNQVRF